MAELTQKQINEAIEAQKKLKKIQERGRKATQRRNARLILFRDKAIEAGITVTDKEIDEYLANH